MQQEGYQIKTDRVIQALTKSQKLQRYKWCCTFWTFWKSCTAVPTEKVRFVLVHLDEKWFYAFKTRRNNKVLTSIGLESNHIYARNKNHIEKEMYVVCTAFIPHENNDLTKGGKSIPIACIRCGDLVEAQKDSFQRVYQDDGTFKYPRIDENQLRVEGEVYFKNYDLTGSSLGTKKDPKCSLLKFYKEQIIPALEEKIVNQLSEGGGK